MPLSQDMFSQTVLIYVVKSRFPNIDVFISLQNPSLAQSLLYSEASMTPGAPRFFDEGVSQVQATTSSRKLS